MKYSEDSKETRRSHSKDCNFKSSLETVEEPYHNSGYIGKMDFAIWTIVPFIGISFCFLHAEQEYVWNWEGSTPEQAQSFEAKTIISVISTIIGGCVTATLLKTVKTTSFTLIKYRGAHFSQLATLIGGFSIANIPMLSAGNGWSSITVILLLLGISAVTKQMAVISMGIKAISVSSEMDYYTRNYTTCLPTNYTSDFSRRFPIFSLEALNSIRNQNSSYTNEYYDRSIPEGLQGLSSFNRVLPFANATCQPVPEKVTFQTGYPVMTSIKSTLDPVFPSAWSSLMTMVLNDRNEALSDRQWLNCSIFVGYATASTSCNNTLCKTHRTSDITPYQDTNFGLQSFMEKLFTMMGSSSSSINLLQSWIAGGNITTYYTLGQGIPGENIKIVQERAAILATVIGRIICDRNAGEPYNEITKFKSHFQSYKSYVYVILWKWPFWLTAVFILISWTLCMFTMWVTPESRVMSVEWLLNQYITRDQWCYISGRDLVQTYNGSFFQIVDQNPDEDIGNIVISKIETKDKTENRWVHHKKRYQ
ncbi:hypothetical protein HPULCUR_008247 [Helicostylum pulchrum]|uniref:Uncharacterized protein n=1 Tax=Helicostylum pulchrum TaxID=562976 RepID=A0ABP9Y726_9FUNG